MGKFSTFYRSKAEFFSKQGLDEVDEMIVELLFNLFVKAFEVGQSQDDNLFGVPLCPVIYDPENSLITRITALKAAAGK